MLGSGLWGQAHEETSCEEPSSRKQLGHEEAEGGPEEAPVPGLRQKVQIDDNVVINENILFSVFIVYPTVY